MKKTKTQFKTYREFKTYVESPEYENFTQDQQETIWSNIPMHWCFEYLKSQGSISIQSN
jgi:hypothetical protein